jgi:hypothetical protein
MNHVFISPGVSCVVSIRIGTSALVGRVTNPPGLREGDAGRFFREQIFPGAPRVEVDALVQVMRHRDTDDVHGTAQRSW